MQIMDFLIRTFLGILGSACGTGVVYYFYRKHLNRRYDFLQQKIINLEIKVMYFQKGFPITWSVRDPIPQNSEKSIMEGWFNKKSGNLWVSSGEEGNIWRKLNIKYEDEDANENESIKDV